MGARPYDLRHAFASLLTHEGRLSVVEIAAQLGHNPTVCLDTYGHVMAEQRGAELVSAEEQILAARGQRLKWPEEEQLSFPRARRLFVRAVVADSAASVGPLQLSGQISGHICP